MKRGSVNAYPLIKHGTLIMTVMAILVEIVKNPYMDRGLKTARCDRYPI